MGMTDVAMRSAFLIVDGQTIVAAWLLGRELPDIDAVIEAARP
jgi:peroxiredoxin